MASAPTANCMFPTPTFRAFGRHSPPLRMHLVIARFIITLHLALGLVQKFILNSIDRGQVPLDKAKGKAGVIPTTYGPKFPFTETETATWSQKISREFTDRFRAGKNSHFYHPNLAAGEWGRVMGFDPKTPAGGSGTGSAADDRVNHEAYAS